MRTVAVVLLSAALGVASAFLVACGDRNELIPADDAAALRSDLDRASADYSREECRASQAAIRRARARAASELPPDVDSALRRTLQDNLDHALARVVEECGRRERTQTTQTTATTPTAPTTETTQETTTQDTTTQDTTTEPPTTEPPTTEPEPEPPANPGGSGGTPPGQGQGRGGGDG